MGENTNSPIPNSPQLRAAELLRPCFACGDPGLCAHREPEIVAYEIRQARRFERLARRLARLERKPAAREIAGATLARKASL